MATGEFNKYVPAGYVGLLFIEPNEKPAARAVIDSLTRKMTAAWHNADPIDRIHHSYLGFHMCSCKANSDCSDHFIGNLVTNSLCIHYLAYHRTEVPQKELDKVAALTYGQMEPTIAELAGPVRASLQVDSSFCGSFADFLKK